MSETANTHPLHNRTSARKGALIVALIVALFVGLYTFWVIQRAADPTSVAPSAVEQVLDYGILPGIIVGVISNATIHVASPWIMAGTNFVLYFGIVYGIARLWQRRKAKLRRRTERVA